MPKIYFYTPYFCVCSQAAIYGHMEVVKVLVNDRASIDIQNNKKETAVMLVSILTVSESERRYTCVHLLSITFLEILPAKTLLAKNRK